ncbi:hypothetical protein [Sinorhizobium meliloti]|uniref:hypothetical protein n=1 Tax=Rhizobium meliloti TaxID=382 RepID=UPI00299D8833|nr:hypothetical protein [Sinorhizobium meliloti]MDX0283756.1 hypothetical protein [Sinorhizobium meliloti]
MNFLRTKLFTCLAATFIISGATAIVGDAEARPRELISIANKKIFAQVILYESAANRGADLRAALNDQSFQRELQNDSSFVNERILECVDDLSMCFATYTKFTSEEAAARYLDRRLAAADGLTRRPPEHHLVVIEAAFVPGDVIEDPSGVEYGKGRNGQNAHIGLFIPQPEYAGEYFDSIFKVKELHSERRPAGWLGDDLASSFKRLAPVALAPNSPKPRHEAVLSVNYGEYDTFKQAEEAYLNRANSGDPDLVALSEIFYGTLQVPPRYYIFTVIGNY